MERLFSERIPIEGFDNEINKYLYSLLASINNVDSSYIHYDGSNDEDCEHVERVFSYELYRQWCNHPIISNNQYLVVNSEIPKDLINEARKNDNHSDKNSIMYPDMVLHHGQNKYKGNLIVCEIKREGYARKCKDKVILDFNKLNIYLSDTLKVKAKNEEWAPFLIGVFILTISTDPVKPLSVNLIKEVLDNDFEKVVQDLKDIKDRVICVVYNGKELKYDTLKGMS